MQDNTAKALELLSTEANVKVGKAVELLRTHTESRDVVLKAVERILRQIEPSEKRKKSEVKEAVRELNESNGMPALCAALEGHSGDSEVVSSVCRVVGQLARTGGNDAVRAIEGCGLVSAVAEEATSDVCTPSASVAEQVFYALAGLATVKGCATEISGRPKTIDSVLSSLATYGADSDALALHALSALASIARFSPATAVSVACSGSGLKAVLDVTRSYSGPGAATSGDICMLALQLLASAVRGDTTPTPTAPTPTTSSSPAAAAAAIVAGGGIEAAVWAMKAWPDNAEAQRWGCALLGLLARGDAEKQAIAAAGGIAAVAAALRTHAGSERVLRQGLKTLGIVAAHSEANAGAVAAAVAGDEASLSAALRHFQSDAELQGAACFAVGAIAEGCRDAGRRLLSAGAGDIALYALRAHRAVGRVQHYGCAAVAALAAADPEGARKRLLGKRALELVAETMRAAPDFAKAQASGCAAVLGLLGADPAGVRGRVFQLGVPDLVGAAMARFPAGAEVQGACLGVLAALAADRDSAARLGPLVPRALDAMRALPGARDVQARCCAFLIGASSKIPANNAAIAAARGAEAVLAAMAAHRGDAALQALGCRCLANFGHEAESRCSMGYGGIEAVLAALARFPGCADLRHWAFIALANSTRDNLDNQLMFVAKGGLALAVATVAKTSSSTSTAAAAATGAATTPSSSSSSLSAEDKSTRYFALVALANACSEDARTRHILRGLGGLEAILGFLRDERNEQAQTAGLRALALATQATRTSALVVGQLGGIGLVLPALRHFAKARELQAWGLRALEHITFNVPDNQQVHWPGAAAETVLHSLRKNRPALDVALWGLRTLANVAYGPRNEGNTADIRKDPEGLRTVAAVMKEHAASPDVQRWGCVVCQAVAAAAATTTDSDAVRTALAQARCIDTMLAALAAHKSVLEVQECALYALGWVFRDPSAASAADRRKVLPALEWAAAAFPSSRVLADILLFFRNDPSVPSMAKIVFSPYAYNRSLKQKSTADVCGWVETLGLRDTQKAVDAIKKYSVDGARLSRIASKDELTKFGIDSAAASMIFNNVRQLTLAQRQRFASIGRPMHTPAVESPLPCSIDAQLGEGPFVPFKDALTAAASALLLQGSSSAPPEAQLAALRSIGESVGGREEAGAAGVTADDALAIALFLQESVCAELNRAIAERNTAKLHSVRGYVLHLVTALRKLPRYRGSPVLYKAVRRQQGQRAADTLGELTKGRVMAWPGFVSATCDEEAVLEFLADSAGCDADADGGRSLLVEIRGGFVGYNVRSFTGCCGEDEIVLEPETTFKILDVQRDIQFPSVYRVTIEVSEPQLALRGALASFHP